MVRNLSLSYIYLLPPLSYPVPHEHGQHPQGQQATACPGITCRPELLETCVNDANRYSSKPIVEPAARAPPSNRHTELSLKNDRRVDSPGTWKG